MVVVPNRRQLSVFFLSQISLQLKYWQKNVKSAENYPEKRFWKG